MLPKITNFITAMTSYFIYKGMNNPRLIQWDEKTENIVFQEEKLVKVFCLIIMQIEKWYGNINSDDWPLSSRELCFRFLVNWSSTESEKLTQIRAYSVQTIEVMTKFGSIFNDYTINKLIYKEKTNGKNTNSARLLILKY